MGIRAMWGVDGRRRSVVGLERSGMRRSTMPWPAISRSYSDIMGQLVDEAGGEQYRCPQCGSFGPKVSDH